MPTDHENDVAVLRSLLWQMHGHTGQYGDDGEMQCSECMREYGFWDWRRTPVLAIAKMINIGNMKKFVEIQKKNQLKEG